MADVLVNCNKCSFKTRGDIRIAGYIAIGPAAEDARDHHLTSAESADNDVLRAEGAITVGHDLFSLHFGSIEVPVTVHYDRKRQIILIEPRNQSDQQVLDELAGYSSFH